jgi:hypothetical protein
MTSTKDRAAWRVDTLQADPSWVFTLDDRCRRDLIAAVRKGRDADRTLLDYAREDFDLGAAWPALDAAFAEAKHGRGIALVRGLPRADVTPAEFELMTWAIGLHAGVARPQGKASHYLSGVRDAGTDYRSASGRGYSSKAELDFHTDGADVVALTCFNQAPEGGMSMVTSSVAAHEQMRVERPDLLEVLHQPFHFSRQNEQAPDEGPFYPNPVYDTADDRLCSKWNRNRIQSAQRIEGVPPLSAKQRKAMDVLDDILRRPDLMYTMYLEPGDMQILSNHTMLHSRTEFVDHAEPERKRLLYRLWLAPPDGQRLPESWRPAYRDVAPASVRGGILGQGMDAPRRDFERRMAAAHGMTIAQG